MQHIPHSYVCLNSWLKTAIFEEPIHCLCRGNSLIYHFQREVLKIGMAVKVRSDGHSLWRSKQSFGSFHCLSKLQGCSLECCIPQTDKWLHTGQSWPTACFCILSCKNWIASLCLTQGATCLGLVHGHDPERCYGEGGGREVHVWERM